MLTPERRVSQQTMLPLLVVAAVVGVVTVGQLAADDWEASAFLRVGEESVVRPYVEQLLGPVPMTPGQGHDGKYFFVQAHDPLLLSAHTPELLEDPLLRAQRVLYPLLLSPLQLLGSDALVWGMLALNLVALLYGSWVTSRLAIALGGPGWVGLAFGLNVGLWFELLFDGSGAVAWAFATVGLLLAARRNYAGAAALFVLAALTRESMLIVALGTVVYLARFSGRRQWVIFLAPLAASVGWGLWIRWRVGSIYESTPIFDFPFVGIYEAVEGWITDGELMPALLVGTVIAMLLMLLRQTYHKPSLVSYGVVGFALFAPFLSVDVWGEFFDISRVVAPALTGLVVGIFLPEQDLDSVVSPV